MSNSRNSEAKENRVYLSGPYTGIEYVAPKMFANAKDFLLKNKKATSVWTPTENIPSICTWEESMVICRNMLTKENIDELVVIINGKTFSSRGVAQEISIAKQKGIKITFMLAFGSELTGESDYAFMKPAMI